MLELLSEGMKQNLLLDIEGKIIPLDATMDILSRFILHVSLLSLYTLLSGNFLARYSVSFPLPCGGDGTFHARPFIERL